MSRGDKYYELKLNQVKKIEGTNGSSFQRQWSFPARIMDPVSWMIILLLIFQTHLFSSSFFSITLYLKIIVNSPVIVSNNTERSCVPTIEFSSVLAKLQYNITNKLQTLVPSANLIQTHPVLLPSLRLQVISPLFLWLFPAGHF